MSAYASRRRHSYITNIFKCGKRGIAIGIYDFGIVHDAGHTIRVGNILGGIQVVHCAVQRGIAVSGVACHIPLCIQINLTI